MDQKSIIKTLEILDNRTEKIQEDIVQIRIDQASNKEISATNKEVAELKSKFAAMEVKVYVFFGFMTLLLASIFGYFFKTNG